MTLHQTNYASGPELDADIAALSGETLVELLDRAAARTPDSVALVIRRGMADERWTYTQLVERSERVAQRLRSEGIERGDRVLTWSQNDPWLVAAYFAVWRLGAVIVPLDLRMQTDVAVRIGKRTRPSLLLAGAGVDAGAVEALAVPVVSVDRQGLLPDAGEAAAADLPRVGAQEVAEILFTSGTTTDPKGVVLTHAQIVHTARIITQTGRGRDPDRALAIIPLSHMYGQTVPLLMGLMTGSTLVFLHALSPKAIAATMKRERVSAVTLVPQLMELLLSGIESEARKTGKEGQLERARRIATFLPFRVRRLLFHSVHRALGGHLHIISSGGARLSDELQLAWELMGVRVVQGYGATECAAICAHTRDSRRHGTVGPPLAGLQVRIAEDGELLVRGPNVMSGYWDAPEATAEIIDEEGWCHTGDAAAIDENGEVVILGRTRDRIALPNGLKVYPEDVEAALRESGAVRAAVVFELSPGRLAAALAPAESNADDSSLAAAVRTANSNLAPHQKVTAWRRWPGHDFPRTHTLKVRRGPVKAWYHEADDGSAETKSPAGPQASSQPSGNLSVEALVAIVIGLLDETRSSGARHIDATTTIESLELDSLDTVTLALRIDEAFEAPLSDDEVAEAVDLAALHDLVQSRQGQAPAAPPSKWAFSTPARLLRRLLDATLLGWLVAVVARPTVSGIEHLEGIAGPVFICPNHQSHLDAPTVRAMLPAQLRDRLAIAAAADTFFDGNPIGPLVALGQGALPFGRAADIRASLEWVADLVNDGWSVMIFPEGTRARDGRLGPMRSGIGLLATNLGVPVVPVHIEGSGEILPPGSWLPRRRRNAHVQVRFGAPIMISPGSNVQDATDRIGRAIADLAAGVDSA
ncbi:MAG: AMP-binding protein [Chloroflexota bacterium]